MSKGRYFGLRFPFTRKDDEGFYVDLTSTKYDRIKSNLTHLIFTPKGSRYRNPDFGTNVLKFIFEPNDSITASDILREIQISVSKYMPDVKMLRFETEKMDRGIRVKIPFTINDGDYEINDKIDIII